MESFIEKCKPRIQNAGDDDWSLVYVGWSKGPLERKDNHYSHGDGSNQVGRCVDEQHRLRITLKDQRLGYLRLSSLFSIQKKTSFFGL